MVKQKDSLYYIQVFISFLALVAAIILFTFLTIIAFFVQIVRKIIRGEDLREYFKACAIGEDQKAGSYLYGTEDYTVSSYTYYLHLESEKSATYFMKFIDFFAYILGDGKEHCKNTYEKEKHELHNGGASHTLIDIEEYR